MGGDDVVDDVGQEDAANRKQLIREGEQTTDAGRSRFGDVCDGQRGGQTDAVAASHACHDKRYGAYRQRTPYSRNEEERAADNKDTFPAESVGKESGGGRSDDGTEHDGGNDEALHESTEPVSGAQEFDGTGDGDGVVAVQQSGKTRTQSQSEYIFT